MFCRYCGKELKKIGGPCPNCGHEADQLIHFREAPEWMNPQGQTPAAQGGMPAQPSYTNVQQGTQMPGGTGYAAQPGGQAVPPVRSFPGEGTGGSPEKDQEIRKLKEILKKANRMKTLLFVPIGVLCLVSLGLGIRGSNLAKKLSKEQGNYADAHAEAESWQEKAEEEQRSAESWEEEAEERKKAAESWEEEAETQKERADEAESRVAELEKQLAEDEPDTEEEFPSVEERGEEATNAIYDRIKEGAEAHRAENAPAAADTGLAIY